MTGAPALRRRPILGMSAMLLPFAADGAVDWAGFEAHVSAPSTPASSRRQHGHRLRPPARRRRPRARCSTARRRRRRPAGSSPARSSPTSPAPRSTSTRYARAWRRSPRAAARRWSSRRTGCTALDDDDWVGAARRARPTARPLHRLRARHDVRPVRPHRTRSTSYAGLLDIRACIGAKHSSLARRARMGPRSPLRDRMPTRLPRVHRQRSRHRHGHATAPTTCSGCQRSRRTRSRDATGAWAARRPGRSTS